MLDYLKERRKGLMGTIFFHLFVIIFLITTTLVPAEKIYPVTDGMAVNFGTDDTGFGEEEPAPNEEIENTPQPQEESAVASDVESESDAEEIDTKPETGADVTTQDIDNDAAEIAEKKRLAEQKHVEEQKLLEEKRLEQERIRKETEEKKRIAEEERKRVEAINSRAGKLFGKGTGTGSEGIAGGEGNQGQLNGVANATNYIGPGGNGKGINYSLSGRSAIDIPLPPKGIQAAGKVVVEILVDRNGNVVEARPGVKGSTTTNEQLYDAAVRAAKKAKFNVSENSPERQKGMITYIFELQ